MQTVSRQNIDGHQYVPSSRNQIIENWLSFFTKARGNWWKHFFLQQETEGVIDMALAIYKQRARGNLLIIVGPPGIIRK